MQQNAGFIFAKELRFKASISLSEQKVARFGCQHETVRNVEPCW